VYKTAVYTPILTAQREWHLSLHAKWLARKTPLKKPIRGEGIVSRKPRPKSAYDFLVYCIVSLFYYVSVFSSGPMWYIPYSYGTI